MMTLKAQPIREQLLARRRALLARYRSELERAEEQDAHQPELIDAATEQWDVRVLSTMSDADARALQEIVEALGRLARGDYGLCVDCGARIEARRLRVLPEATQCMACAEFTEQRYPREASSGRR
jgi:RNA polymerase-binding protein DksA